MPTDVTKEDIWQAAETLAQENITPTIMNIRSKFGGGSPHAIAFHLTDWRVENREQDAPFLTDWEAQELQRKELEQEQIELMEEIDRLDANLNKAREEATDNTEALNTERKAHESMKSHGERWYQQLQEAQDTIAKLTAQNQTLQTEVAVLKEQANRNEELKAQVEKLQKDLTDLAADKGTKTSTEPKKASPSKSAKTSARKPVSAKKPETKKPAVEIREPRKTFPPTFGVAQKIT
uniref:Replication region DNA-binding N-term n=1 Tax=Candidatus Kentrum sp. MB TaxID=2138164 RepID=A0A450XJC3_9GAMM|nr:MAG: replication region DNA-binding N-term [Candidatus Kentron sp. MB]VFK33670.1 MAG: replication region DNA-binding N-term [Candidatus Kentron sp. MB]VFK76288.1 MAG: replication region DNA-binding N-term [Candidatus Kentron sp. MB]